MHTYIIKYVCIQLDIHPMCMFTYECRIPMSLVGELRTWAVIRRLDYSPVIGNSSTFVYLLQLLCFYQASRSR